MKYIKGKNIFKYLDGMGKVGTRKHWLMQENLSLNDKNNTYESSNNKNGD